MQQSTMNRTIGMTTENVYDSVFPKICSIIILPMASTIAGSFPIKLWKIFHNIDDGGRATIFDKAMAFFLYFGGGVLLCTIFLHLLPEIREKTDELQKAQILKEFGLSFAELVMCIGFFTMFFIEESLHYYLFSSNDENASRSTHGNTAEKSVFVVDKSDSCLKMKTEDGNASSTEQYHINTILDDNKNYRSCSEHPCHAIEHRLSNSYHTCNHDFHVQSHLPDRNKSAFAGLFTVIALSVHELFEGLAVGLEPSPAMVWYLLTAISCHKIVLAVFIGVQLLVSHVRPAISYLYVVAFSLTSPVGIIIGVLMSTNAATNQTVSILSVTLQAIATGTLLYIVFFEVYAKQLGSYKLPGMVKVIASVVGFVFMALLQLQLED